MGSEAANRQLSNPNVTLSSEPPEWNQQADEETDLQFVTHLTSSAFTLLLSSDFKGSLEILTLAQHTDQGVGGCGVCVSGVTLLLNCIREIQILHFHNICAAIIVKSVEYTAKTEIWL